ncbi:MAG: RIP metalloprotease RseP [Alphaproteobacteria bacterium]
MDIFEVFQMVGGNVWTYGGAFVLVLSVLVFVHEWGHYSVARLCGVRVEVFSIGFGKELFGFDDSHGTRWKFSMIPLGGYVKMFGDTDPASAGSTDEVKEGEEASRPMTEAEKAEAFFAKPVWQRALVVIAGPAINYIFAILLFAGLFALNGQPVTPPVAAAVIEGSAADKAGFEAHDALISIDGVKINSFEDIRREMMIALDTEKHFVVQRGDDIIDIYAKPEKQEQEDRFGFKHSRGLLGLISPRNAIQVDTIKGIDGREFGEGDDQAVIAAALRKVMDREFDLMIPSGKDGSQTLQVKPVSDMNAGVFDPEDPDYGVLYLADVEGEVFVKHSLTNSFGQAIIESWDVTRGTLEALGQMITGTRSAQELGGIIRIGALAGDMAQQGLVALVLFAALLSINLGLINMFPIPMLDGGHLVFYFFEAILGKPVPEPVQEYAFRAGLVILIGLMAFANINDILQLVL